MNAFDVTGGFVRTMSGNLVNWQSDIRIELNPTSRGEWSEWLGDQAERVKREMPPASIRHGNWRP